MSLLIVESGATKADWCLLKKKGEPLFYTTPGISPYLQTIDEIATTIQTELLWNKSFQKPEAIVYYGTGSRSNEKKGAILKSLKKAFPKVSGIEAHTDMLASARALCSDKKGIVCILGTGSNSCYYDGKNTKLRTLSLGYIAGDEGSGNHLGKRVLQHYAYNTFDAELKASFEKLFGADIDSIIRDLYDKPYPNRQLAGLVDLLIQNRGHFMVENIIEDCFNDFFHYHVLKHRESWTLPIHFTGSVAYGFKDVLANICDQYELSLGKVVKSPLEGLLAYHRKSL